MFTVTN